MKLIFFSRPGVPVAPADAAALLRAADAFGMDWAVGLPFALAAAGSDYGPVPSGKVYTAPAEAAAPESVLVSYGGDGTLLEAVRMLAGNPVPVLGINSGRLGFLAAVPRSRAVEAVAQLAAGRYSLEQRPLLKVSGDFPVPPEYPYAFNEFSIVRHRAQMIDVEVEADGERVAVYRGDGVLLSTPAGSTAYSLSVGGPIVAPGCNCFVLAPVAPHNLNMRPLVIPDSCEVRFRVDARGTNAIASLDNDMLRIGSDSEFRVKRADSSIFLVKLQNISFLDTLRNKMMWGLDSRDRTDAGKKESY